MSYVTSLAKSSFPSSEQWQGQSKNKIQAIGAQDQNPNRGNQRNAYSGALQSRQGRVYDITCKWEPLRKQLSVQWARISLHELDEAGPNRAKLARLIENKYGISYQLAENYLRNFERVLPVL